MKKILIVFLAVICALNFVSCESCSRDMKSLKSDLNGGLERTLVVYDYNGDTLQVYEGKFDIRDNGADNQVFFDLNGKRVWIQGGIVISEEK